MSDHGPDTETGARWLALVRRYYDGCSAGDVALTAATLHPDIEHFFRVALLALADDLAVQ